MTRTHTQDEVDARARDLIAQKLLDLIDHFDGSDWRAKEILRGFVAARRMGMEIREFADALTNSHALDAA